MDEAKDLDIVSAISMASRGDASDTNLLPVPSKFHDRQLNV